MKRFEVFELTIMKYDGTENKIILKDSSISFSYGDEWAKWNSDRSKIIFSSSRVDGIHSDIFTISRDGSALTNITNTDTTSEFTPSFSPDGKTILYISYDKNKNTQLYVCSANGSNVRQLTNLSHPLRKVICQRPVWSSDGTTIYFNANKDTTAANIYSVKSDGTDLKRITTSTAASDWGPAISRNGQKLVFYSSVNNVPYLFSINSDGTNRTQLTTINSGDPVWSPDGSTIAFTSDKDKEIKDGSKGFDIYTIKADGTGIKRLTNTVGNKFFIDWR